MSASAGDVQKKANIDLTSDQEHNNGEENKGELCRPTCLLASSLIPLPQCILTCMYPVSTNYTPKKGLFGLTFSSLEHCASSCCNWIQKAYTSFQRLSSLAHSSKRPLSTRETKIDLSSCCASIATHSVDLQTSRKGSITSVAQHWLIAITFACSLLYGFTGLFQNPFWPDDKDKEPVF